MTGPFITCYKFDFDFVFKVTVKPLKVAQTVIYDFVYFLSWLKIHILKDFFINDKTLSKNHTAAKGHNPL